MSITVVDFHGEIRKILILVDKMSRAMWTAIVN